jgi:surfactin synthase thioesterase subunit
MHPSMTPRHLLEDDALIGYIKDIGGLPTGINIDFLRATLPVLKDDYRAFETYSFEGEAIKSLSSVHVFGGDSDKSVKVEDLAAWIPLLREHCQCDADMTVFQGSHFYYNEEASADLFITKILTLLEIPL